MLLKALSPNGKALDSDSSIFQVRILVALLNLRTSRMRCPFLVEASGDRYKATIPVTMAF